VLAREFYGDEKALIKIDMSEFSERHTGSKLIGTAPGYVGYEEGGRLTEQVRRKPYSVVLFDELEKGDPEVFNILLQILEDGEVTDGKGRKINFRNAIVIMTSNLGSEEFNSSARKIGFDATPSQERNALADFDKARAGVLKTLERKFKPEFVNRIDKVVVFRPLDKATIGKIVELGLNELKSRLADIGVKFGWKPKAVEAVVGETFNPEFGARPVRRFLQDKVEDPIAALILAEGKKKSVTLGVKNGTLTFESA
jgi:ATP-dependent Clp protease ATP-binding subunit ClpC